MQAVVAVVLSFVFSVEDSSNSVSRGTAEVWTCGGNVYVHASYDQNSYMHALVWL